MLTDMAEDPRNASRVGMLDDWLDEHAKAASRGLAA